MTLRKIDTGERPFIQPNQGTAPELLWVDISALVLDDTYQRPLLSKNWKHILKIAGRFQWSRFSVLTVSRLPGGKFAVIDGQHRAHAAALCGIQQLPCLVHHLSVAEQAASFSTINGDVQAMTAFHVYRAALAAREKWAVDSESIVKAAGCRLMSYQKSANQKNAGEVFCVTLIRRMVEAGEGDAVRAGLAAIMNSEAQGDPDLLGMKYLKPWLAVLASNSQFLKLDLAEFLNEFDLIEANDIAAHAAKNSRMVSRPAEMQRLVLEALKDFRESRAKQAA